MPTITYQNTPIYLGENFETIHQFLPKSSSVFVITDENVFAHWNPLLKDYSVIVLPAGENQKSLSVVESVINELIERGADRSSFLIGLGGGVICDITGFTASVYMRGIGFAFAPTTLLAQVDASIGGKNGVNTALYKNMIGVFNQPKFILTDTRFLKTLPQEEFTNGLAEVVKHACIKSLTYFEYLEKNVAHILKREEKTLFEIVLESVKIKSAIVEEDPNEKGIRKILNFGHTYGHAIEKTDNIAHGKAVSLGMIVVNEIAVNKGFLMAEKAERVKFLLEKLSLPTVLEKDISIYEPLLSKDKKKNGKDVTLVLLEDIGKTIFLKWTMENGEWIMDS